MELPNIGKRCTFIDCKQLDFLPLQCKCQQFFCMQHFNEHAILCGELNKGNVAVKHILDSYKCAEPGCTAKSVIPIECTKCQQYFCVQHRHVVGCAPKDPQTLALEIRRMQTPVDEFRAAKTAVDQQIEDRLDEAKRSAGKKRQLANKIQLMRLKGKAKGSKTVPPTDWVYFNVFCDENPQPYAVFVSKTWSVGRVIDALSDECHVVNNNHKSNEKKLRLFKKDSRERISGNLSDSLEILLNSNTIIDGEDLILCYVNE